MSCWQCLSRHGLSRMLSGINCSEPCFEMQSVGYFLLVCFCLFMLGLREWDFMLHLSGFHQSFISSVFCNRHHKSNIMAERKSESENHLSAVHRWQKNGGNDMLANSIPSNFYLSHTPTHLSFNLVVVFPFLILPSTRSFVLESENWTSEHVWLLWRVNRLLLWRWRNGRRRRRRRLNKQKKQQRGKKNNPSSSERVLIKKSLYRTAEETLS